MHCGRSFVPDPAGKAYSTPKTLSWIYGSRSAAKGKGAEIKREEEKAGENERKEREKTLSEINCWLRP